MVCGRTLSAKAQDSQAWPRGSSSPVKTIEKMRSTSRSRSQCSLPFPPPRFVTLRCLLSDLFFFSILSLPRLLAATQHYSHRLLFRIISRGYGATRPQLPRSRLGVFEQVYGSAIAWRRSLLLCGSAGLQTLCRLRLTNRTKPSPRARSRFSTTVIIAWVVGP